MKLAVEKKIIVPNFVKKVLWQLKKTQFSTKKFFFEKKIKTFITNHQNFLIYPVSGFRTPNSRKNFKIYFDSNYNKSKVS